MCVSSLQLLALNAALKGTIMTCLSIPTLTPLPEMLLVVVPASVFKLRTQGFEALLNLDLQPELPNFDLLFSLTPFPTPRDEDEHMSPR